MKTILSLENVGIKYRGQKSFGGGSHNDYWAIEDISFQIEPGDTLGIIGRNGAGKSTLLKMICGIFAPDKGTISRPKKIQIQLLSLGVGFERNLSGRENAILNGMLLGKSRKYMRNKIETIKEFSELGDFFEKPVKTYSSGMVARLGFSVALEVDADILLIDEVLSVGDSNFGEKSAKAIQEKINSNKTIIMVSHDESIIRKLCNRCVLIENKKSIYSGPTEEALKRYHDLL